MIDRKRRPDDGPQKDARAEKGGQKSADQVGRIEAHLAELRAAVRLVADRIEQRATAHSDALLAEGGRWSSAVEVYSFRLLADELRRLVDDAAIEAGPQGVE